MADDGGLLRLLKEFIAENKFEHQEIRECLALVKNNMSNDRLNHANGTPRCNNIHNDIEERMRSVEELKPLKDLPKKFDELAVKMYKLTGGMIVLATLASWLIPLFLKNFH